MLVRVEGSSKRRGKGGGRGVLLTGIEEGGGVL